MNKLIKMAVLPVAAVAALAFATPAAHADEQVRFSTLLQWGTNPNVLSNTATSVTNSASSDPTELVQPVNGTIANGLSSTATYADGSTLTYNGEQVRTSVDLLGDQVGVTFGNFTANMTARTNVRESFTLEIYEYKPQDPAGHVDFSAEITGNVVVTNGEFKIDWDPGAGGIKDLPHTPTPPIVGYSLGSFPIEQINLDTALFPTGNEILGDVQAVPVPLPKSASVSMALFGLLGLAGIAKRKSMKTA